MPPDNPLKHMPYDQIWIVSIGGKTLVCYKGRNPAEAQLLKTEKPPTLTDASGLSFFLVVRRAGPALSKGAKHSSYHRNHLIEEKITKLVEDIHSYEARADCAFKTHTVAPAYSRFRHTRTKAPEAHPLPNTISGMGDFGVLVSS